MCGNAWLRVTPVQDRRPGSASAGEGDWRRLLARPVRSNGRDVHHAPVDQDHIARQTLADLYREALGGEDGMLILGINEGIEASVVLCRDGTSPVFAVQEERLTREKGVIGFPAPSGPALRQSSMA
jgi:hypothetical protein